MPIGELTIKNDDLGAIIGRVLEGEPGKINFDGTTTQEQFEDMIGTYALDIMNSGWAAGKDLDFSYDKLSDFPVAVASCYQRSRKDMNEHGLPWDVRFLPEKMRTNRLDPSIWGGVSRITTGKKHKADFLLPVLEGCQKKKLFGKKILSFDLAALFKEYKTVTGVDLEQHGLKSIAFDL